MAESEDICEILTYVVYVLESLLMRVKSQESRSLLGKNKNMDQIADMITRIKNAGDVNKESLVFPYSKIKFDISNVLEKHGYLKSVAKKGKKITKFIEVELNYGVDGAPKVTGVQRVSKLSKRIYQKSKNLQSVKYGTGLLILTTPKGIMTNIEAKKEKVGGEVLFKIW